MRPQFTRILLVFVALLPLEVVAMSGGAVWRGKQVVVRDYTPAEWRPYVVQTVVAFNAMLPKRAPRLVYQAMSEGCPRKRARGITVCAAEGDAPGDTESVERGSAFIHATVRVSPWDVETRYPMGLLCHEFMHATTGIPDAHDRPHAESSCVQGYLDAPGAFDRAYARWAYKKFGHDSGPRDRDRRKHR